MLSINQILTEELEKTGCECSDLWHRNIIHWIALILVIIIPINILIILTKLSTSSNHQHLLDEHNNQEMTLF